LSSLYHFERLNGGLALLESKPGVKAAMESTAAPNIMAEYEDDDDVIFR
jgi:hypothetical protein